MTLNNITLTKEDFDTANWEEVISASGEKDIYYYVYSFKEAFDKAQFDGNEKLSAVFKLLWAATAPRIILKNPEQPFYFIDGSIANPKEIFSKEELLLIKDLLPAVKDSEMKSRLADLTWVGLKDYRVAPIAIQAYVESAMFFEHASDIRNHYLLCKTRIIRAFQIARTTSNSKLISSLINYVDSVLDKFNTNNPNHLALDLLELILGQKELDRARLPYYADLSAKCALFYQNENTWHLAGQYWAIQAKVKARLSDVDGERQSLINLAESFVIGAQAALTRNTPSNLAAAGLIGQALKAYPKGENTKARREELYRLMLQHQESGKHEFGHISQEGVIDISEAQNLIKDKDLTEALRTLALVTDVLPKTFLADKAEEIMQNPSLSDVFVRVTFSDTGKVVAITPSLSSDKDKEQQAAKQARMFSIAREYQQGYALEYLHPMMRQIMLDHALQVDDLLPILTDNHFIPKDREQLYALGFLMAFKGDYISAVHLLIPQFENSLRHLLWSAGLVPSYPKADGSQAEINLNNLLYLEYGEKLSEIFDASLVFDLRGLLVENFGSNLRNDVVHGLLSYTQLSAAIPIYTSWLIFRMVYLFKYHTIVSSKVEVSEDSTS